MATDANYEFDVALSFASEDRVLVEQLADCLQNSGVRVFYDVNEQASLWGKDLYQHLQSVYRDRARYCVIFVSQNYARRLWTSHELRQAQARAFAASEEYILPIRLDDTDLPGLNATTSYVDFRTTDIQAVCKLLLKKLGASNTVAPRTDAEDDEPELLDLRVDVDDHFRHCMEALAALSKVGTGEKEAVIEWGQRVQALTKSGSRDARQMQKLVNERATAFRRQRIAIEELVARYSRGTGKFFASLQALIDYQVSKGLSTQEEMLDGVKKFSGADRGAIGAAEVWEQNAQLAEGLHALTKDFRKERNAYVIAIRDFVEATREWLTRSKALRVHLGSSE